MKRLLLIVLLLLASVILPLTISKVANARTGVGVGTGKIYVDTKLKPGVIYELPSVSVINTGDEVSDYELAITYHQDQKQLLPKEDWFIFNPDRFTLEPNQVQIVEIKLNLPLRVEPGDYFAYVEAHPIKKVDTSVTSIGVAAAAKLYFTVIPANAFLALWYKITSFWKIYSPWTNYTALAIGFIFIVFLFKKFFKIQINVKKSAPENKRGLSDPNGSNKDSYGKNEKNNE